MAIANVCEIWHFLVSAGLSIICFVLVSFLCQSKSHWGLERNLLIAGVIAFCFGLAKEVAEYLSNRWFWCKPACQFDGWDIFVNLDGVLAGLLCVILVYLFMPMKQSEVCDATVASTIYPGDGSEFFLKDPDEEQGVEADKAPSEQAEGGSLRTISLDPATCTIDSAVTTEPEIHARGDRIPDLGCPQASDTDTESNTADD